MKWVYMRYMSQHLDSSHFFLLYHSCCLKIKAEDIAPSLFERNCALTLKEAKLESELVNDEDGQSTASIKQANRQLLREALSSAAHSDMMLTGGEGGGDGVVMGKKAPTLAELLRELAEEADSNDKGHNRGTRFTHATDFGQEQVGAGGNAALRSVGGSVAVSSASKGEGDSEGEVNKISAIEAARQKAEAEQKAREDEIDALEKSLAETEARVAGGARDIGIIRDKTRQVCVCVS